jgi:hypothetical protein
MEAHTLIEMLDALTPVLKSRKRAEQILEKYWSDKVALIWTIQDVHRAANEWEIALTNKEALEILKELHQHHNHQYGLKWSDLSDCIKETGFGRDLSEREIQRFVEKDIIAINKPGRRKGR